MTTTAPFLTVAESRAAHLRQLSLHMTALALDTVALADVQREIPELEAAMSVYRRLSSSRDATANGASPTTTRPRAAKPAPGTLPPTGTRRSRRPRRGDEPPSFKEFALTHLDSLAQVAGDGDDGVDNGARTRALQSIRPRRQRQVA